MIHSIVRAAAVLALLATGSVATSAQTFPSKPIKIIVPFPAGGPNDFFARVMGNKLSQDVGQPIIIENKPGAAGVAGVDIVAKAPPDGYTVVLSSMGAVAIVPSISDNMPYDPFKDLAPITIAAKVPEVLVAIPKLGVKTLPELIAKAKANPGKINFASAGSGGLPHLAGESFKREAKIDIVHIPYRGAAPAVNDLIGGQVDIVFLDIPVLLPHIEAGTLIPLALGSGKRASSLPNVPTTAELGLPNVLADNWYGLFAPVATPKETIAKLHQVIAAALKDPSVQQAYAKQGAEAIGNTPEEFRTFWLAEAKKWGGLAKEIGVKID
jgi:tripartite-type tricarboxylate transporter receptor subunit TctC